MAELVHENHHFPGVAPATESRGPGGDAGVHELVLANARRRPDAVALASGNSVVTYAALAHRARRLAGRLRALGVGPDVPVGLCVERSPELAVGALGILSAGGAYVALDASYPEERLAFTVADSEAPVVVTRRALVPRLHGCAAAVVAVDDLDAGSQDGSEDGGDPGGGDLPPVSSGGLAYVIYTSGSTGTPKGVMDEHRSLANLVRWHLDAFGVTPADRASQVASPGFDAAVWELWPYLVAGASVRFPAEAIRADVAALRDWLLQERITIGFLPTPLAEAALDLPWPETAALRVLLTGGDTLHKHPGAGQPFVLVNNYGPTESTVVATSGIVPAVEAAATSAPRPPSIGKPVPGCRAVVVDGDLRPVTAGSRGELLLGGPGLARGYLNRPELTADRFVRDPFADEPGARLYRTGDLVRELPGGELEFLGRLDDQVEIRGHRIEPAEIAAALDTHPHVAGSAVTAPERPNGERHLVAYVVPGGGRRPEPDELRRHLERLLPAHMVPAAFVYLSELPLTANGKVDRAALPGPPAAEGADAAGEPRSELERELAVMVARLLGLARVGVDQDFFVLGGHSLMAAQLVAGIRDRYGVDVALISIFQAGTVAGLAAAVERLVRTGEDPFAAAGAPLDVLAQPSGSRPALFFLVSDESGLTALHHFIRALGDDQPVVGLVPPRRDRRFERGVDVTRLAERQVAAIRERQPHGPYCLCGHSLGGLLAYEAAGQLREQGEQVAWVGLLDTMVPAASRAVLARERRLPDRLRRLRSRAGAIGLLAMLREAGLRRVERLRASLGLPLSPDQFDFPGADVLTVGYRVVGHDAPLEVFATSAGQQKAGSRSLGWEGLHRGPLEWHPVSGDHDTVLHQPAAEAVELLARRLFEAQRRWAAGAAEEVRRRWP